MPRTLRDSSLDTRAARARLKARRKPYYRLIEKGRHLGYYKGDRIGSWLARVYLGAGKYETSTLGLADDASDADGSRVLNYSQAQAAARKWFTEWDRGRAGKKEHGPYTVGRAIDDYLAEHYDANGKAPKAIKTIIEAHIRPEFGTMLASDLTSRKIKDWHAGLAKAPARLRTAKAATERNTKGDPDDDEKIRRRRSTANNVLSIFKAILNHAWREERIGDDGAWRKVRPFPKVDAPVIRYLSPDECTRLVNACPKDLREIVRAGLLTGMRYQEIARLTARDYDATAGTVLVRTSKSGRPRHVVLNKDGQDFFATATTGKPGEALLFKRENGHAWGKNHQSRPLKDACNRASIDPPISFHVLRHTHGSMLAMNGTPMAVISAQLGHADTRMTEKHYAHLSPSYVADTVRANMPSLGIVPKTNVKALKNRK